MIRGLGFGLAVSLAATGTLPGQQEALPTPRGVEAPLLLGGSPEPVIARLERLVPDLLREATVPGLQIALVHQGAVIWHRGFGVSNAQTQEPVMDRTIFEAASLSKPVFAHAVLQLADSGLLDLDRPLSEYLPDYEGLGGDSLVRRITARQVLSHTTGFPNWRPRDGALRIHFPPGDRFSYSGEGFVYLSKVIERITGQPFNQVVTTLVFEPLGMARSSYLWRDHFDADKADLHSRSGQPTGKHPITEANPAASLHTTAENYGRFVVAILNGTGLANATLAAMLTPQIRVDERSHNMVSRQAEQLSPSLAWGLGWGLQQTEHGLAFWHWGDNGDSKAYVVAYPASRVGLVVLTNSANGLAMVPDLLDAAIGGEHPAFEWLRYGTLRRSRTPGGSPKLRRQGG